MLRKSRVAITIMFVGVVGATLFFAWHQIFKSSKKQSMPSNGVVSATLQTPEQSAAVMATVVSFEQLSKAYGAKDYAKTINLAKNYSANDKNDITLRLNSYNLCIRSAFITNDTISKDECYAKALALVATLNDVAAVEGWKTTLQQALTNIIDLGDQKKGGIGEAQ